MDKLRFLPRMTAFALTLVGALVGFWGMFQRAAGIFGYDREDMSHGYVVPVFSLYVLWTRRAELKASVGAPSWAGLAACVPCLALALLGTRGLQFRFEQLGFIGLAICMPWAFFGRRTARLCVFPALYLLFTIPVSSYLDFFTVHLRLLASGIAMAVLNGFGFEAVQQGTAICSTGAHAFSIDVAEPCSGLRSIFALMALTAAYAWYAHADARRRVALFLCSIPLAVLGNVMRILTICLVAAFADADFALGFYHDYSGYVVFAVAIVAMLGVSDLLGRIGRKTKPAPAASAVAPETPAAGACAWRPCLFAFLLCAVFAFQAATPAGVVAEAPATGLPVMLADYASEKISCCQEEKCLRSWSESDLKGATNCPACGGALKNASLGEFRILPADTRIEKRIYVSRAGGVFHASLVVGGASKSSIHRPELCLPAQGNVMSAPRDFTAGGRPFHALGVTAPGRPSTLFAYTFFNQAGVRTASHARRIWVDVWDRSVLNRVDRWVMATVTYAAPGLPRGATFADPRCRAEFKAFLVAFARQLEWGKGDGE